MNVDVSVNKYNFNISVYLSIVQFIYLGGQLPTKL